MSLRAIWKTEAKGTCVKAAFAQFLSVHSAWTKFFNRQNLHLSIAYARDKCQLRNSTMCGRYFKRNWYKVPSHPCLLPPPTSPWDRAEKIFFSPPPPGCTASIFWAFQKGSRLTGVTAGIRVRTWTASQKTVASQGWLLAALMVPKKNQPSLKAHMERTQYATHSPRLEWKYCND